MSSYTVDGISEIAAQVKAHNPDIITIQELTAAKMTIKLPR